MSKVFILKGEKFENKTIVATSYFVSSILILDDSTVFLGQSGGYYCSLNWKTGEATKKG